MVMPSIAEAEQIVANSEAGLPASEALADATVLPGDEPAAPEEKPADEQPAPEPAAPAEPTPLEKKVAELERQLQERQTAEQQATQKALQDAVAQEITQSTTAITEWLTGQGIDEMNVARLKPYIEAGIQVRSQSFQQSLQQYNTYVQGLEAKAHALDQVFTHFPPNTTIATVKAHLNEIASRGNPQDREWLAKNLAAQQLQSNQAKRVASGAEQVPGGARTAGGATDFNTLVAKAGDPNGSTLTPPEERRLAEMMKARGL